MEKTPKAAQISDLLWTQLCDLRQLCSSSESLTDCLALGGDGFVFLDDVTCIDPEIHTAVFMTRAIERPGWTTVSLFDDELYLLANAACDDDLLLNLRLYVLLCAVPFFRPNRSFVVVHMAATLDGRVSTEVGNSKWIGNEENLVHAHRMRALVDGVVVGARTAEIDLPYLNVRHVSGNNPVRIVLGDTFDRYAELPGTDDMQTILIRSVDKDLADATPPNVRVLRYDIESDRTNIFGVLEKLRAMGVQTILVEGGPATFRSFLDASAVDWLQVHIAPMIFGSGTNLIDLPEIATVKDALRLKNAFYTLVGAEVMVTGEP
jgi:diaminohydroxyphosphoribosylaminopyrimidine deaminase/5-amino-6-(5-phosphoribosylamino)uracil reductase